ncbi:MAG: hypothetical protein IKE58_10165 [Blautia sp.]|nr:hypothetical protein [Blautia sp.]
MKLKVTKRYVDKYTKETVPMGTVLQDVTEARAQELLKAGVAEKIKAKQNKDDNTAPEA